jgi:hypothetical protein
MGHWLFLFVFLLDAFLQADRQPRKSQLMLEAAMRQDRFFFVTE